MFSTVQSFVKVGHAYKEREAHMYNITFVPLGVDLPSESREDWDGHLSRVKNINTIFFFPTAMITGDQSALQTDQSENTEHL